MYARVYPIVVETNNLYASEDATFVACILELGLGNLQHLVEKATEAHESAAVESEEAMRAWWAGYPEDVQRKVTGGANPSTDPGTNLEAAAKYVYSKMQTEYVKVWHEAIRRPRTDNGCS